MQGLQSISFLLEFKSDGDFPKSLFPRSTLTKFSENVLWLSSQVRYFCQVLKEDYVQSFVP